VAPTGSAGATPASAPAATPSGWVTPKQ
jgi:hypothetical protein